MSTWVCVHVPRGAVVEEMNEQCWVPEKVGADCLVIARSVGVACLGEWDADVGDPIDRGHKASAHTGA